MKKLMLHGAAAAIIGAAALAATATTASAEIVCNHDGDCWHVREHYDYQPSFGLTIHRNDWRWRDGDDHYRWREHEGRGYWRGGVWLGF